MIYRFIDDVVNVTRIASSPITAFELFRVDSHPSKTLMAQHVELKSIANPFLTGTQIVAMREINLGRSNADSFIFAVSLLTQSAGILLGLPQEVIASCITILQRYLLSEPSTQHTPDTISAAAVYTCAKQSFYPLSPRSILNVYAFLTSRASPLHFINSDGSAADATPKDYYLTPGTYERLRQTLFTAETALLQALSFDTSVVLPHKLALTYLQALPTGDYPKFQDVALRVFEHLNAALLSPQLLYLTHQPNQLAVAAIYFATRELKVKLPEVEWWEVFDVEREDLGFLVLSMGSLNGFAEAEEERWHSGDFRLTV